MLNPSGACRTIATNRGELRLDSGLGVVGVLNVTPDSFSDGGRFCDLDAIAAHASQMQAEGAAMIDVGGVSTRPGAAEVDEATELARVIPAVQAVAAATSIPLSIDTYRASVMEQAIHAGASVLNDVTALRGDTDMVALLAETQIPFVLMHMEGAACGRGADAKFEDVVGDVKSFFQDTLHLVDAAGLNRDRCILDPGLGFDKDSDANLHLLRDIERLQICGQPLLVGASRKRFIGEVLNEEDPASRDPGTAGVTAHLYQCGVELVRVHNVRANVDLIRMLSAIGESQKSEVAF
jgi:dihydropteroate synthase